MIFWLMNNDERAALEEIPSEQKAAVFFVLRAPFF